MWLRFSAPMGILIALLLSASFAWSATDYQIHGRYGLVSANYSGVAALSTGAFSVGNAMDIELELHQTTKRSFSFRSTIGMDLASSDVLYYYAGVGSRHYIFSSGSSMSVSSGGSKISIVPKFRHYLGVDFGMAQLKLKTTNDVLSTHSTTMEFGANYGFIYQMSRNMGLQFHLGTGFGYGFSSISVTSSTLKVLLGMAYYF